MKYTMREKKDGSHEILRFGEVVDRSPNNAEIEFWLELEELRDKLPKTADGVPITPGMKVWRICGDSTETEVVYRVGANLIELEGSDYRRKPCDFYSSPLACYKGIEKKHLDLAYAAREAAAALV